MSFEQNVFYWIKALFLFSLFTQSVEDILIQVKINRQFLSQNLSTLGVINYYSVYLLILKLILIVLLVLNQHPVLFMSLFVLCLINSLRWNGSFNGGSDSMNFLVLLALTFGSFFINEDKLLQSVLYYLAILVCISYFLSGWVKIKNSQWRSGEALSKFLKSDKYQVPPYWRKLSENQKICLMLSWGVLVFEVLFPICVLDVRLVYIAICFGLLFHVFNFILFGINRFIWSWIPAYPALIYLSKQFFN